MTGIQYRVPFKRSRRIALAFALAAALLLVRSSSASAQALADRVPDDAVIYVGWNGAENLGAAYASSHFKAVLDQTNFSQAISQALPQLIDKIVEQNPDAAQPLQLLSSLGPVVWTHPTAFYFGGVDIKGNPPMPKVAILVDAGKDAAALLAQVQGLVANVPPAVPLQVTNYNGLVAITLGRTPEFDTLLGGPAGAKAASPLSQRKEFQADIGQMTKSPVLVAYADVTEIVALGDLASSFSPQGQENWPKFRDMVGLKNVRSAAMTTGFDDKDWSTQVLVTPAAGTTFSPGTPLTDEILKTIPADATVVSCQRFNFGAIFDRLHDILSDSNPPAARQLDHQIEQLNQLIGMDFRKDVLQPLGADWTAYSSPTIGGNGMLGMVLVNHLADAAKADQALAKLETVINQFIAHQNGAHSPVHVAFNQTTINGTTVHYLAVPFISPSWAIKDGNLYVALYPQVVASAIQQAAASTSILDNADFNALRKRLGGQQATGIAFYDLPKTAANGYSMMMLLSQILNGGANMFGIQTPAIIAPQLDQLLKEIDPAGAVIYTDANGWHMKAVMPFPGSTILAGSGNSSMIAAPIMVYVLLPSLNKARDRANQTKDSFNLHQIGMACMLYANEKGGALPQSLGDLVNPQEAPIKIFISPLDHKQIPPSILQGSKDQQAAWVNANSSYVYLGAGKKMSDSPEEVLAYENFSDPKGTNVLFVDGHEDWMPTAAAHELIDKQTRKQP